jgi:hypothetical protein
MKGGIGMGLFLTKELTKFMGKNLKKDLYKILN